MPFPFFLQGPESEDKDVFLRPASAVGSYPLPAGPTATAAKSVYGRASAATTLPAAATATGIHDLPAAALPAATDHPAADAEPDRRWQQRQRGPRPQHQPQEGLLQPVLLLLRPGEQKRQCVKVAGFLCKKKDNIILQLR